MGFIESYVEQHDVVLPPLMDKEEGEQAADQVLPFSEQEEVKRAASIDKVETLNFLKPCQICKGSEFIYGKNGGFFCRQCQPGQDGVQVLAGGSALCCDTGKSITKVYGANDHVALPVGRLGKRTGDECRYFRVSYPWIQENINQLLHCGWTRRGLFGRTKLRYPCGPWGLSFSHCWAWGEYMTVEIDHRGAVVFSRPEHHGYVRQRMNPF